MNPQTRYATGAIVLHWLIALLIVLNYAAAWFSESQPREVASVIMGNHKAFGITILALTVLRILWRMTHRPPPLSPTLKPAEAILARAVHALFYVMMLAMPLSGWAMTSPYGPVSWFGLFDVPGLPVTKAMGGAAHEVHEIGAWLLIALFVLHVAGALKHQFLDGSRELARMGLGRR
jgi:cytochrome b561